MLSVVPLEVNMCIYRLRDLENGSDRAEGSSKSKPVSSSSSVAPHANDENGPQPQGLFQFDVDCI